MKVVLLLTLTSCLLCLPQSLNAENGALGSSSKSSTVVSLTIEPRITLSIPDAGRTGINVSRGFSSICSNMPEPFRLYQFSDDGLQPVGQPSQGRAVNCAQISLPFASPNAAAGKQITLVIVPS